MIEKSLYEELCNDFFPVFKKLSATGTYAITLGGSHGKGISDQHSDFDFRIYYEKAADPDTMRNTFQEVSELVRKWKEKGVEVDGVWPRSIADIQEQLDAWLSGQVRPVPTEWTIWGYSILTDIFNQQILEDPHGIAQQWKTRLQDYPTVLEKAIVGKYSSSLRYWRNDYHYINKVNRKDVVFLASITARLVNDIMQVIYALNHFYYPGDGMNLKYTKEFAKKPDNFEDRIALALYPQSPGDVLKAQYDMITELIDETLELALK